MEEGVQCEVSLSVYNFDVTSGVSHQVLRHLTLRPPPVSSFSSNYPGNDIRYQEYLSDIRYSFRETMIRSIEKGELQMQRKLPKAESLRDCMDRTIPFFKQRIMPEAVDQGKRVLISSSENAIRGLLMHLCDIPEEEITGLEIPNGLPLIFDVKSKCVKVRSMLNLWLF
jgi:2,3-bisphosphoglycerate-dependent phosphoglycerate mutase